MMVVFKRRDAIKDTQTHVHNNGKTRCGVVRTYSTWVQGSLSDMMQAAQYSPPTTAHECSLQIRDMLFVEEDMLFLHKVYTIVRCQRYIENVFYKRHIIIIRNCKYDLQCKMPFTYLFYNYANNELQLCHVNNRISLRWPCLYRSLFPPRHKDIYWSPPI